MVREDKATWKANYFTRLVEAFDTYSRCFLVNADNVGSKQMQQIRQELRGRAVVLMGKNTMMRKAIRGHLEHNPALEKLLPHIIENVGFVFTNEDLTTIRDLLQNNKVRAPAKANAIAPIDVGIPAQNTGLGPEMTSFFQALSIMTKISKGTIEITSDVALIKAGDKVGPSEATLLNKLNISPFSYGLKLRLVYDEGSVYDPAILDITEDDLKAKFMAGVANVASVSLACGYPTPCSAPHSIVNGFKNILGLAIAAEYEIPQAEQIFEYLKDPSKFAVAAAPAAAGAPAAGKKEEKKAESEEEEDDDMGFSLFD